MSGYVCVIFVSVPGCVFACFCFSVCFCFVLVSDCVCVLLSLMSGCVCVLFIGSESDPWLPLSLTNLRCGV